jgi:hypothetical protein
VSINFRKHLHVKFHGNSILELRTRRPDGQGGKVALIRALLQVCVEALPQSSMFISTMSVLPMLLLESCCSDERRIDVLFIRLME